MLKKIKSYFPSHHHLENASQLRPIKRYLNHPNLWKFNFTSVSRGVAIGCFCAIFPIFQMILAGILAIIFRGNLYLALLLTWISNPFTLLPISYLVYNVGKFILGTNDHGIVVEEFHWKWEGLHGFWISFSAWVLHFGKAFFVGLPFVAFAAGFLGYFCVLLIWAGKNFFRKIKNNDN